MTRLTFSKHRHDDSVMLGRTSTQPDPGAAPDLALNRDAAAVKGGDTFDHGQAETQVPVSSRPILAIAIPGSGVLVGRHTIMRGLTMDPLPTALAETP